jgi:hypothetical protein
MKQAISFILPAMLMAFGGAQAQTMPAQQAPQPSPQPASAPQQQIPQSGPATAAQTASCGNMANHAITAMNKGDFDGATKSFDPGHKPPGDKLQQAWGALTKQYGDAKSIGNADKGQVMQGYTVVLVPMQFDKGQVGAEAACSADGQLEMLRFGLMPNAGAAKS